MSEQKNQKIDMGEMIEKIKEGAEFFKCSEKKTWAKIYLQQKRCIVQINSKFFKAWVDVFLKENYKKHISLQTTASIIDYLNNETLIYGKEEPLHSRITFANGAYWYYLANREKQAVRIDALGWSIKEDNLPYFRDSDHSLPQVVPDELGNIHKLLDFIPLTDEYNKLLFLVYVVSCFIPNIPHPILTFHGCKGSAKTTSTRMVQKLVDPQNESASVIPRSDYDLGLQLSQSSFVVYDNLSQLFPWQSDMLCRAVTGGSVSKRENYTDTDMVRVNFQGCIALNGINLVVVKSDLLDRSILFSLQRISEEQRKPLQEIEAEFAEAMPSILGGIFSTLSKAILEFQTVSLKQYPRMADFCKWGCAIAKALGYTEEEFWEAYQQNIQMAQDASVEANQLAMTLESFMKEKEEWTGSIGQLYAELEELLNNLKLKKDKTFPASANKIMAAIQEISPDLQAFGIRVEKLARTSMGVIVKLSNLNQLVIPAILLMF